MLQGYHILERDLILGRSGNGPLKSMNESCRRCLAMVKPALSSGVTPMFHVFELFWILSCGLATSGLALLAVQSHKNFSNKPVSFLVDRDSLEWNTSFPAVSVCEADSDLGAIAMSAIRLFGPSYELDLETFLRDIVFFDGNCYSCEELCGNSINCSENLSYLVKKVRQPCQHLLSNCFWMGEQSDCCELFRPLETETGLCFSANSLHTPGPTDQSQFILNQKTGPGRLQFKVSKDFNVYIHTPEDVPYINAPPDIKNMVILGSNLKIEFMVSEIENDPMLGTIPVEKRKCMFPRENIQGKMYRYYSYSGCVVDCRAEAQKKICNCTHHFMLAKYGTKTCNIKGLACLSKHSKTIGSLKSIESHKPGLVCSCIPSCTEHNHLIIETVHTLYEDGNYSLIGIYMKSLPTTRFRRYIVRNKLDLIVSLGGTAGLFLGASLLSIAEWFYFMVLRRSSKKCKTSANQINTVEKRRNEGHINNPISNSKNKALLIVPLNVQLY